MNNKIVNDSIKKLFNDSSIDGIAEKNIDCFPSCIIIIIYILIHINGKYTERRKYCKNIFFRNIFWRFRNQMYQNKTTSKLWSCIHDK